MGKFDRGIFFKHKSCMDVFFCVAKVSFDDDGRKAVLKGHWCTQGVETWWVTMSARLMIRDEYANWLPYVPTGRMR